MRSPGSSSRLGWKNIHRYIKSYILVAFETRMSISHRYASTALVVSPDILGLNSSLMKLSCLNNSNKTGRTLYPPWTKNARRKRDALKCGNAHFWNGSTLSDAISLSWTHTKIRLHCRSACVKLRIYTFIFIWFSFVVRPPIITLFK